MAKALFVTRQDISVFTATNGNVDNDKLLPFIFQAQNKHIQNYLGSDLYNKLQADIVAGTLAGNYLILVRDYLKPMLEHFTMVEYLPYAGVNISNSGIYTKNPENSTALTKDHVDSLIENARNSAQFYTERFLDYIKNNLSLFPEYQSNTSEDMYPDDVAFSTGWVIK